IALTSFMKDCGVIVKDERKFDETLQDAPLYFQNKQSKLRNEIDILKHKAELKVSNGLVAQEQKPIQDVIINLDNTIKNAQKKLLDVLYKPAPDEKEIKKNLTVIAISHFFKMPNIAKRYPNGVPKKAFKAEYEKMLNGQTLKAAINEEGLHILVDNAIEGKGEELWKKIKVTAKKVVNGQQTNSKESVSNNNAGTEKTETKKIVTSKTGTSNTETKKTGTSKPKGKTGF
ncbi:MAG: hypothetical protein K5659_00685, partial [Lachnospiraceae bacterium]|nr:hypothetical protein [Lachnospiraceae bacterium]